MSYTVRVRVRHSRADVYFRIAEMAVYYDGAWADSDSVLKLTMGGSGTSGMLRFQSEDGDERFAVAIGVHNYKPWVHILPDLATSETTIVLLPQYYAGGKHSGIPIVPKCNVQSSGPRDFSAEFTRNEGNRYSMEIVIG
ncbi:fruit body lectin [Hypoxylon argillaceum]|nr:fruit body lectin [Hypoxylon argillaceum]